MIEGHKMENKGKIPKPRIPLQDLLKGGDMIRPDELAEGLKVSQATVYQWCKRGVIPHYKIEDAIRFDPQDIKPWLREKYRAATRPPGGAVL